MPGGEQIVEQGDKLLLIGTASQLQVFDAAVRQRSLGLERCDLPQSLREFMLDNHQNKPELPRCRSGAWRLYHYQPPRFTRFRRKRPALGIGQAKDDEHLNQRRNFVILFHSLSVYIKPLFFAAAFFHAIIPRSCKAFTASSIVCMP